jgi:hypothetical protein
MEKGEFYIERNSPEIIFCRYCSFLKPISIEVNLLIKLGEGMVY